MKSNPGKIPSNSHCECVTLKNRFDILLSAPENMLELATLDIVRSCTPWLDLERCRVCGQHWLIATDTVDDRVHFHRLSAENARDIVERDKWPATFDLLANVWPDEAWLQLNGFASLEEWRVHQKGE